MLSLFWSSLLPLCHFAYGHGPSAFCWDWITMILPGSGTGWSENYWSNGLIWPLPTWQSHSTENRYLHFHHQIPFLLCFTFQFQPTKPDLIWFPKSVQWEFQVPDRSLLFMSLSISAGRRLYDAIHESRHFGALSEASETTAQFILLLVAALLGRLDLHGDGLFGRFSAALHSGQVRTFERKRRVMDSSVWLGGELWQCLSMMRQGEFQQQNNRPNEIKWLADSRHTSGQRRPPAIHIRGKWRPSSP